MANEGATRAKLDGESEKEANDRDQRAAASSRRRSREEICPGGTQADTAKRKERMEAWPTKSPHCGSEGMPKDVKANLGPFEPAVEGAAKRQLPGLILPKNHRSQPAAHLPGSSPWVDFHINCVNR